MNGWIVLVPFAWVAMLFAFGAWWRVQNARPLMPRVPDGAQFGETMCSGRALGGGFARLGGVNNCLVVAVARDRLSVDFAFPFSLFPFFGKSALVVDVPISAIRSITPIRRFWQPLLRVEFVDPDRADIEIVVRDEAGLCAALGPKFVAVAGDRPLRAKTGPRLDGMLARVLMGIVGAGFVLTGSTGVLSDLAMRRHGIETPAVVEGFAGKTAILKYRIGGVDHRIGSRFNGTWHQGDATRVIVLPDNPAEAVEPGMLPFMVMFAGIGAVLLAFAFAGARMVPGWS